MATFNISVTVPDANQAQVLDRVATKIGWTATVKDAQGNTINNPETKLQVLKRHTAQHIKNLWLAATADLAEETKAATVAAADSVTFTSS